MDVDEENNDGEGEQPNDNDGNPGTNASNASLRRGGRQRKKVITPPPYFFLPPVLNFTFTQHIREKLTSLSLNPIIVS